MPVGLWWLGLLLLLATADLTACQQRGNGECRRTTLNATCDADCREETIAALAGIYRDTGGPQWTRQPQWRIDKCAAPTGEDIPGFCCYQGVSCCCVEICSKCETCSVKYAVQGLFIKDNGLQGRLADLLPHLEVLHKWGLQDLSLEGNRLTGPLPSGISSLVNMSRISLGSNGLTGTIPNTLYNLTKLASLGLDQNKLNGTIPDTLCGVNNSLTDLYLRGNQLVGDVNLVNCTMLINLDVQDNALTGDIPASDNWKQMHVLRLSNNKFERIPETFYRMERMVILDANNNNIAGTLSSNISQLEGLTNVYLESNKLTGTIPRELFQLKRLSFLYLDFNNMSGTVPDNLGDCSGTITVNLRNNEKVTGYIPSSTGKLRFPSIMDFVGTNMHGCNSTHNFTGHTDCLPDFLEYDESNMIPPVQSIPVRGGDVILGTINSSLKCPTIKTRPNASDLPDSTQWLITETYYNYKHCQCDTGFVPIYQTTPDGFTVMNCTLATSSSTALLVGVLVPVLVCAWALLLFGFSIFMKKGGWFGLKRYKERAVRRMTGMKREGEVSIVVTDIENYSELLKALGPEMMEALRLHNDTMRKAKWDNCGSTVEQEGDSFSIVFHDAMDAVAFCLQAQQKLMKVEWPAGLGRDASLVTKRTSGSRLLANMRMLVGRTANSIINRRGNSSQLGGGSGQSLQPALETMSSTGPGFLRLGGGSRAWRASSSGPSFQQQLQQGHQQHQQHMQGDVPLNASAPAPLASLHEGSPSELQQSSPGQQQGQQPPLAVAGRQFSFPSYLGSGTIPAGRQGSGLLLPRVSSVGSAAPGAATATAGGASSGSVQGRSSAGGTNSPAPPPLLRSVSPVITPNDGSPRSSFTETQQPGSAHMTSSGPPAEKLRTHSDRSQASSSGVGSQGEMPLAHSYQSAPMSTGFSNTHGRHGMGAALTQPSADDPLLFNGLRVRMGVATGVLERGQDVKNTAVWQLAKVVSDAASGGQVLMEGTTFNAIKERLAELGAVDENGMNFKRLSWKAKAGWFSWLGALNRTLTRNVQQRAEEAVILDMGQYSNSVPVPVAKKQAPAAAAAAGGVGSSSASSGSGVIKARLLPTQRSNSARDFAARDQGSGPRDQAAAAAVERAQERAAAARAAAAIKENDDMPLTWSSGDNGGAGGNAGAPGSNASQPMHLFQILPQPLAGRARVFGNKLVLAEDITCIDPPYFAAPGTLQAQLVTRQLKSMSLGHSNSTGMMGVPSEDGTSVTYSMRPLLPPVTMVFTKVDLDRPLVKRSRDGRACHQLLSSCIRAMLALVPGGYFCREQEGDLKYMTVFSTPQAAMEWCLLVQQASMYLPWPETLLAYRQFRVEEDSQQQLAFRGPRLKMGVCEGTPNSIQPDHLGRADYHGESINLAARFMDAAAHGGQVVCELDLAQSVFDSWRHKQSCGGHCPFGRVVPVGGTFKSVRRTISEGFGSVLHQPLASPQAPAQQRTNTKEALQQAQEQARNQQHQQHMQQQHNLQRQQQREDQQQREQQAQEQEQQLGQRVSFEELRQHSSTLLRSHAIIGPEFENSSPEPSPASAVDVLPISEDSVQPVTVADVSAAQRLSAVTSPLSQPLPGGAFGTPFAAASGTSNADANGSSGTYTYVSTGSQHQSGSNAGAAARLAASEAAGEAATLEAGTAPAAPADAPATASAAAADAPAAGPAATAERAPSAPLPASSGAAAATLMPPAALQPPSSSTVGSGDNQANQIGVPTVAATAPSPTPQPLPAGEWQLCTQSASIHHLGSFNFKGNQQAKTMVFVTLQSLQGRSFPEDPPRGKGMRVQAESGVADRVEVVLPDVVHHYKAKLPVGTMLKEPPMPRTTVRSVSTSLAGLASDRRVASTTAAHAAMGARTPRDAPDAGPSWAMRQQQGGRMADDQV